MRNIFLISFIFTYCFGYTQTSEKDLLQKKLYNSVEEANTNPQDVYRLNAFEFDAEKDGFALKPFINLTALDLSKSKLPYLPMGIKKLTKLQHINLSHSTIKYIYSTV